MAQDHQLKGEFVLLIGGNPDKDEPETTDELAQLPVKAQVEALIAAGDKPNVAIKTIAKRRNIPRQSVYNQFHELNTNDEES